MIKRQVSVINRERGEHVEKDAEEEGNRVMGVGRLL